MKIISHADTANKLQINRQQPVAFYGKRAPYYTQKYIELPNIEEFLIEIVPEAFMVYNNGKSALKTAGSIGFMQMLFFGKLIMHMLCGAKQQLQEQLINSVV